MGYKGRKLPDRSISYDDTDPVVIRGSLFPEDLVRRQIDRCNRSASLDYEAFCRNVEILAMNLPTWKLRELDERREEFTTTETKPVFQSVCGVQVGTIEHPKLNKHGDIVSPRTEEVEETDYYMMYRIVLGMLEESGLSWKVEQEEVDGGKVSDTDESLLYGPPTPTFESTETGKPEESEEIVEDDDEELDNDEGDADDPA